MRKWAAVGVTVLLLAAARGWSADDIADQRHFKSSNTKHALSSARRGMEWLFTPLKHTTNWAERVDLRSRIRDFFYNDAYTAAFMPAFSVGGELGGVAGGLDAFHRDVFAKGKLLRGGFLYREPDAVMARASYEDPAIHLSAWHAKLLTHYVRDEDVEIYSQGNHLGMSTRSEDEGSYGLTRFEGRAEVARHVSQWDIGGYARGTRGHAEPGKGGGVPLSPSLVGLDEVVHLGGGGAQLEWDRRSDKERPTRGTLVSARGGVVGSPDRTDTGELYRYSECHAEAVQFFTLFGHRRVFGVRAALDRVDSVDHGAIPFYELPVVDKNHGARNLPRGRFRDQGALVMNTEYRYPIWVSWDAYAFFDAGQSFETYDHVRWGQFRFSEGFGVRFGNADRVLFNVVVGLGREKPQIGVDFSQIF